MAEPSSVVVVESPAKARTINKYLGRDYRVLASYGHVRDLPAKNGSVDPDQDFRMVWEIDAKAQKRLKEIADAVKHADRLILATDPDREGEAISWHVLESLKQRRALGHAEVQRVVFNAVTKSAVLDAIRHPRDINEELVDAYLARRALDYLVGFTLSPVLWRKLPGARSAGRVQSVALRLICERELEIEAFKPQEYWTVEADFSTPDGNFTARLTHASGSKLDKLSLSNADAAKAAVAASAYDSDSLSSLLPLACVSLAVKLPSGVEKSASTVQYSCGLKASISSSRSQISRSATDCTRPAERAPGSLRQSTGDSVKPTR